MVQDFSPLLREAIGEARSAGFAEAAAELESRAFGTAFTTSSEMLGEQGAAIRAFLASRDLPEAVVRKLEACLAEIRKVWPRI